LPESRAKESAHVLSEPGSSNYTISSQLGNRKGIRPVKTEWWGAGVVFCLELGADFHTAELMPLPLTVSCFSKIQIGFTFLVAAHLGSPGKRAVKRVCVCVFHNWPFSGLPLFHEQDG